MKYKVGDKVRVKSKEWFDEQAKDSFGDVYPLNNGYLFFVKDMYDFCGSEVKISECFNWFYYVEDDVDGVRFEDWMLEYSTAEPIKKHVPQRHKYSPIKFS